MLSLCFEGLGLVDIDPRHQPVKLPPRKIPDLRLLPGPLIAAMDRQPLVDQYEAIRFTEQSFDPVPSSSTEKKESTGVRGKVILQPQGKEFFTWRGKNFFPSCGKEFFT